MKTTSPLQIFKPGTHAAMSGDVLRFSAADLAASATAYNPALFEAPIVIGHPKIDGPAYGWVKSLAFASGGLEATPDQVDPAFAEMVAAGRFKKISASFYNPTSPSNPVPGVYYLRHVGFLGAQAPAVKGLRNPAFAESEAGVVEFSEYDDVDNASLWRSLREWILAKFGLDEADKVVPGYKVQSLEQAAQDELRKSQTEVEADQSNSAAAFSETKQENAVTPKEKAALEAENAALKQQIADEARAKRHASHASFAESLAVEGKLLPAQKEVAIATLDHLAAQAQVIEFGEANAQGGKKTLADAFKAFLSALPKQVEFGEHATLDRVGSGGESLEFAAPAGYGVDGEAQALHRKALAHQAQHGTDYLTAARSVSGVLSRNPRNFQN